MRVIKENGDFRVKAIAGTHTVLIALDCKDKARKDLAGFAMQVVLNRRLASGQPKRFQFIETEPDQPLGGEPGLHRFLQDASLSADTTQEEIEFLKRLRFKDRRPTPLYYYRELQNLRDPLHYRTDAGHPSLLGTVKE